jgi:D-alanyl-D-alanine dipeptidase
MSLLELRSDREFLIPENNQSFRELLEQPIPRETASRDGWKEVPIVEPLRPEPMIALGPFSDYADIYTSSIYFGEHANSPYEESTFSDSMISLHVREGVAEQLRIAQSYLPEDTFLIVLDAYRPIELQAQLYTSYFDELKKQEPTWSNEKISEETQRFVSLPMNKTIDPDTHFISPHNTGGAVDVALFRLPSEIATEVRTIDAEVHGIKRDDSQWKRNYELQMRKTALIQNHGEALDFGTKIDQSGKIAALNYYELLEQQRPLQLKEKTAQRSRRMLYNTMTLAGFEGFADEWWHYNSEKTQMGAKQSGITVAEYGAGTMLDANRWHEHKRKIQRDGSITLFQKRHYKPANLLPGATILKP